MIDKLKETKNSIDFAKLLGRKHCYILVHIRNIIKNRMKESQQDFILDAYVNTRNRFYPQYLLSDKGLEILITTLSSNRMIKPDKLYLIQAECFFKVGITNNLKNRLDAYRTLCPIKAEVIAFSTFPDSQSLFEVENKLLKTLSLELENTNGEWFRSPNKDSQMKLMCLFDKYVSDYNGKTFNYFTDEVININASYTTSTKINVN